MKIYPKGYGDGSGYITGRGYVVGNGNRYIKYEVGKSLWIGSDYGYGYEGGDGRDYGRGDGLKFYPINQLTLTRGH